MIGRMSYKLSDMEVGSVPVLAPRHELDYDDDLERVTSP